jgi:hypothetical protein
MPSSPSWLYTLRSCSCGHGGSGAPGAAGRRGQRGAGGSGAPGAAGRRGQRGTGGSGAPGAAGGAVYFGEWPVPVLPPPVCLAGPGVREGLAIPVHMLEARWALAPAALRRLVCGKGAADLGAKLPAEAVDGRCVVPALGPPPAPELQGGAVMGGERAVVGARWAGDRGGLRPAAEGWVIDACKLRQPARQAPRSHPYPRSRARAHPRCPAIGAGARPPQPGALRVRRQAATALRRVLSALRPTLAPPNGAEPRTLAVRVV